MNKKIVHICVDGPVTDGWTYQDNLLPKYHKIIGFDVSLITSNWVYNDNGKLVKIMPSSYLNEYNIKIIRLPYFFGKITSKLKIISRLYRTIQDEKPNILFVHGFQYLDIYTIVKYLKKNRDVRVYVDNHSDYSNSASNLISKKIFHKIIWARCAHKIEPYVTSFYGVLPARVDILIDLYNLPRKKCKLLVMGGDDEKIHIAEKENPLQIKKKLGINLTKFTIVSGGKIDGAKKQILSLMKVMKDEELAGVQLLVFGSIEESIKSSFFDLVDNTNVFYCGWINPEQTYSIFNIADLVVFPGRHSVFWEQVVAQSKPIICKWWEGTNHIDIGGNVEFLMNDSYDELKEKIKSVVLNKDTYNKMLKIARCNKKKLFLYSEIAKRSIDFDVDVSGE